MAEIKAVLIFEMLGRPAEHLKETLAKFVETIGKEKGVSITSKKLNEPKKIEPSEKELYTTFAEIEANFKNLETLIGIVFVYMPSHIEILSPTEINIKNFEINSLLSNLTMRLHKYDELAKVMGMERELLKNKLQEAKSSQSVNLITNTGAAEAVENKKEPEKTEKRFSKRTNKKK
jgi:hypothetical protein